MKAAVYYENGPPEVLRYEEFPDPECESDGILMRVAAVSVEGGDTLNRADGPLETRPHVVGYQAAGEVIEVGVEVDQLRVGQRVTTINLWGSHAELRAVPAQMAWPIPDGADIRHAAAVPVSFGTADRCLFEFGRLTAGETVLVQAGGSGLGLASVQLAKRAGATVIATASSAEKLERLIRFGMDYGINYVEHDLVEEVLRLTDGRGVDLVVDPVGGTTLQKSILSLAYRGRVCMVGDAGREPFSHDLSSMIGANQSLFGYFLGAELHTKEVHDMIQGHVEDVAAGELEAVIDSSFPLEEAASAHAYIESRKSFGRVLLIP